MRKNDVITAIHTLKHIGYTIKTKNCGYPRLIAICGSKAIAYHIVNPKDVRGNIVIDYYENQKHIARRIVKTEGLDFSTTINA
jgi:hypothetical protein